MGFVLPLFEENPLCLWSFLSRPRQLEPQSQKPFLRYIGALFKSISVPYAEQKSDPFSTLGFVLVIKCDRPHHSFIKHHWKNPLLRRQHEGTQQAMNFVGGHSWYLGAPKHSDLRVRDLGPCWVCHGGAGAVHCPGEADPGPRCSLWPPRSLPDQLCGLPGPSPSRTR